jgi:hypothetical protein
VVTTFGPGALIDLPRDSAIVAGLETWPGPGTLDEVVEPRLTRRIQTLTGVPAPRLYAPPPEDTEPGGKVRGIGAWRFPEWFVVHEKATGAGDGARRERSRRLVHRKALDHRRRFDGCDVVATRFVRTCPRGHVDDIDWRRFVHQDGACRRQLWLDERGTTGDLADLVVRCECGAARGMHEATLLELNPLGPCSGARPWLGRDAHERCGHPSRLLIRTATNAYFPQVLSVLSLPERAGTVETVVRDLWEELQVVHEPADLGVIRRKPAVARALHGFTDAEILVAIRAVRSGAVEDRPAKHVELDALLAVPEGFGEDVPVHPDFHARRLPTGYWKRSGLADAIEAVVQVHRLREVLALIGFTRLEPVTPDINGEYDTDVERAAIARDPEWFPAVENRGEGLFLLLRPDAVASWLDRPAVRSRVDRLRAGHDRWNHRRRTQRPHPGGPYVLAHTLSHLLIQTVALRCGYPASSIRERIYVDADRQRFGILLYTATADAEGTLGGLVGEARNIEDHLAVALRAGELCSNDPICAQHTPGESLEQRWLHGAACHGCVLVAETSCEMRNDHLDRALVVPIVGVPDAAFFGPGP